MRAAPSRVALSGCGHLLNRRDLQLHLRAIFSARSFRENKCLSGVYAPFDFMRRRSANANNNNKTQQQQREAKAQI